MTEDKPKKGKYFKTPMLGTVCPKCKSGTLTIGRIKDFKCMKCYTEFNQEDAD